MAAANSDQLKELDAPLSLTHEQIEFYKKNGFIRIKDVLSTALLDHYRGAIEAEVDKASKEPIDEQLAKDMADDSYARAFVQILNLWLVSHKVREFVFGKRLASIAAQLMGVDGVRVYHDQALFKAPKGGHTPFHCDQFYWPVSSEKTVTAWVPLVPVPQEMGPMEFVAGSQKVDMGRAVGIGVESDHHVGIAIEAGGYELVRGGFDLGEVSFHAGWTFHRAGENSSDSWRKIMTIIYMDKDIRMTEPANDNQRADAKRYLEGVKVGGVCSGPRNPLVWQRAEGQNGSATGAE